MSTATKEQIDAARKAYFDASWELYNTPPWGRNKLIHKREQLRRALLKLEPGHFSRVERESFEQKARETLPPEEAERRIAEYKPSKTARELDCV